MDTKFVVRIQAISRMYNITSDVTAEKFSQSYLYNILGELSFSILRRMHKIAPYLNLILQAAY